MTSFVVPTLLFLISGQMVQKYAVFLIAFLLICWINEIRFLLINKNIPVFLSQRSRPTRIFLYIQPILVVLCIISVAAVSIPTPHVLSPDLPLLNPIEVSPDNPLIISFDRPVSKKMHVSITPYAAGRWNFTTSRFNLPFNQIRFYPEHPLLPDTEYAIELSEIAPFTTFNTLGNDDLLFVFKTIPTVTKAKKPLPTPTHPIPSKEAEIPWLESVPTITAPTTTMFELKVPLYKQNYSFTCFSIAAKMALAYKGIDSIDEIGFLQDIGFDQTPRNFATNTWGDPNKSVVGTYDGSGDGGYGVHWNPVARIMNNYRKTEVKRNWDISEMLRTVEEGNPVMVWWVNGFWPAKNVSWNLPSGEKVYTVNGMHVEVVVGWIGDRNNPTAILTNDPWRGRRSYTPEQFLSLWKWFDHTGIVVF